MNQQLLYDIFETAEQLKQQGRPLIELNIGQPDQLPPTAVIKAAKIALDQGQVRYGPAAGLPELLAVLAELHHCQPENILVGPGSKWLIHAVLKQLLMPQKPAVIIITPAWSAYQLMVADLNGQAKILATTMTDKWQPDLGLLEKLIDRQTAAIIINSPNNPTSTAIRPEILAKIHRLAQSKKISVLHDWAYAGLSFTKPVLPAWQSNNLHLFTFSKTFCMTGFRLGYLIAPADFIDVLKRQVQLGLTCLPAFIQQAGLVAITNCRAFPDKLRRIYQARADFAAKILSRAGAGLVMPDAGFYLFADIHRDSLKFSRQLLDQGVVVVPGPAFGNFPTFIRIALTQNRAKLKQGLKIIAQLL